jgi:poly(U)-binding-splicing factor PUF60
VQERVQEENLKEIFEAFGKVKQVSLPPNIVTRKHKGYAFIEFETSTSAHNAVQAMNGFELGGLQLKVMKAMVGIPMPEGMSSMPDQDISMPANVVEIANAISRAVGAAGL